MARPLVIMNRQGMKALLNDPGVRADLLRRARAVEASYSGPTDVPEPTIRSEQTHEADSWGRVLTRVEVTYPAAPWRESQSGHLAQALDSGVDS